MGEAKPVGVGEKEVEFGNPPLGAAHFRPVGETELSATR